tara:strand:+ start:42938 stop:44311 length:1374 start_codon:yes stop_codon:yes gene_type:complete
MAKRVLLIDDDDAFREVYHELLTEEGYVVYEARDVPTARAAFAKHNPRLVVLDLMLPPSGSPEAGATLCDEFLSASPNCKIVTISGTGDTKIALSTVRRGAYDFLTKPIEPDVLFAILGRAQARFALEDRVASLETSLASPADGSGLLGSSETFLAARSLAEKVAPTEVPVLITGATGTGKEVIARYLHQRSSRASGPFIAINCGALNANLLESTLFGHVKGSFTGAAHDSQGLFRAATGGTLFLDEIGDTDPALQVKLLRALEAREVLAVGATEPTAIDIRLVSATHQPLAQRIREGTFREDLYWRIRGIEVELPLLANRSGDLELLAKHFINQARALIPGAGATTLCSDALRAMEAYSWPGNLRELRHEMQRGLVMAGSRGEILEGDLSPALRNGESATASASPETLDAKIASLERSEIVAALAATAGNKSQAAERLGVSRQGLLNKIARHGIGQ